jgi:hypothetical protein
MKRGLIALIGFVFLSAPASHSASAAYPVLVSDKDTVAGIDAEVWDGKGPWLDSQYVRIRNASTRTVSLDSLRFPSESIQNGGYASPLELAFAVRSHSAGTQVRVFFNRIPGSFPIAIAAGDSIDVGLFEIGRMFYYAKSSALAPPRRYQVGDSILAPLTLFAGGDSVNINLKAKVHAFVNGLSGILVRKGRGLYPMKGRTVTVDGRSLSATLPAARLLFE